MAYYTVQQLARMAGVSVRTLHHYHEIGLLAPAARTAAGYRLYGEAELLRLQQILLYRDTEMPLAEIRRVLDAPTFDGVEALRQHRERLVARGRRLAQLIRTIELTIQRLEGDPMAIDDPYLYAGLTPEQAERYPREAREKYGAEVVEESERRLKKLSKQEWQAIQQEGQEVTVRLAELADRAPDDPEVQALIARHYAWVSHFWTPTAEAYEGLGRLYVENDEFHAFYDRVRPGLADFMCPAMAYYAEHSLRDK